MKKKNKLGLLSKLLMFSVIFLIFFSTDHVNADEVQGWFEEEVITNTTCEYTEEIRGWSCDGVFYMVRPGGNLGVDCEQKTITLSYTGKLQNCADAWAIYCRPGCVGEV